MFNRNYSIFISTKNITSVYQCHLYDVNLSANDDLKPQKMWRIPALIYANSLIREIATYFLTLELLTNGLYLKEGFLIQ